MSLPSGFIQPRHEALFRWHYIDERHRKIIRDSLDKLIKGKKKKGLTINCREKEIYLCKKKSPKCGLRIGDDKIKMLMKFKYQWSVLKKDGKHGTGTVASSLILPI